MNARRHFQGIKEIVSAIKLDGLSSLGIGKPKEDWSAEIGRINALRQEQRTFLEAEDNSIDALVLDRYRQTLIEILIELDSIQKPDRLKPVLFPMMLLLFGWQTYYKISKEDFPQEEEEERQHEPEPIQVQDRTEALEELFPYQYKEKVKRIYDYQLTDRLMNIVADNLNGKEFSALAHLLYNNAEICNKPNTATKWFKRFSEAVGMKTTYYKECKVTEEISRLSKRLPLPPKIR